MPGAGRNSRHWLDGIEVGFRPVCIEKLLPAGDFRRRILARAGSRLVAVDLRAAAVRCGVEPAAVKHFGFVKKPRKRFLQHLPRHYVNRL